MLLEKVFDNLAMTVEPFATCRLADGWRMRLPVHDWVTLHYTLNGDGELKLGSGEVLSMPGNSLAVMPPNLGHAIQCGIVAEEIDYNGQDFTEIVSDCDAVPHPGVLCGQHGTVRPPAGSDHARFQ